MFFSCALTYCPTSSLFLASGYMLLSSSGVMDILAVQVIPAKEEIYLETFAQPALITNSGTCITSTLAVHCRLKDKTSKSRIGHPASRLRKATIAKALYT